MVDSVEFRLLAMYLQLEVFNILFVTEQNQKFTVHCFDCAKKADPGLIQFTVLNQYTREELVSVYESFQLHSVRE